MRNFTLQGARYFNGEWRSIDLTPSDYSYLTEFTGFEPLRSDLMSQQIYNRDGAVFQASRGQVRNIVLTIYLFRDVELNRKNLLRIFQPGSQVQLMYSSETYTNSDPARFIYGYVETIEFNRFEQPQKAKQVMQIAITCFDPFFNGQTNYRQGYGPLAILFDGTAPSAVNVNFLNTNNDERVTFSLRNGNTLTLNFNIYPVAPTDRIYIDSVNHEIKVSKNGVLENAIQLWEPGSKWLTAGGDIAETLNCNVYTQLNASWKNYYYSIYD